MSENIDRKEPDYPIASIIWNYFIPTLDKLLEIA